MNNPSKKQFINEAIFADIIRGVYDYSSIITEKNLCKKYEVSKSPVREALIELCNEDILESVPRMGYRIKPYNISDLIHAVNFRIALETAALSLILERIDDTGLKSLKEIIEEQEKIKTLKDPYEHWKSNAKFHTALVNLSGNPYFAKVLNKIMRECFKGASLYYTESWEKGLGREDMRWHYKLYEALESKDKERCITILSQDIGDFRTGILNL